MKDQKDLKLKDIKDYKKIVEDRGDKIVENHYIYIVNKDSPCYDDGKKILDDYLAN